MSGDYFDEDALLEGKFDRHIFGRLLSYARPHVWLAVVSFVLVVATTALGLVMPYVMGLVIDEVREPVTDLWGRPGGQGKLLGVIVGLFLTSELVRFVVGYAQNFLLQLLGQRVVHDLRMDLFRHVQRLPLSFFHKQPVGRLVTRLAFDVDAISEMFSQALATAALHILTILGVATVMLWLDLKLGALVMVTLPLMIGVTLVFRALIRVAFREVARLRSAINAFVAENVNGAREVQAFAREAMQLAAFDETNQALCSQRIGVIKIYAVLMPCFRILSAVSTALVIGVIGSAVLDGKLQLGMFGTYFFLVRMLVDPLRDLAEKYNLMQNAMASADRIFRIMDEPEDPTLATPAGGVPAHAADGGRARGEIAFEGVTFGYDPDEPVLRDVSFRVAPGESVALVGHTGSGKSTIFRLLARFWEIREGAITLDGVDIRRWQPDDLRRQIAFVQQDPFLFAGDIRGNIALGDEVPDDAVEEAARVVGVDTFVRELPGGYAEPVVEGGETLSSGQRQLISFARAVLRDAPILALDEATASIDTRSEKLIQSALERITADRTCLVIAHRLSTIERCDRILVLDHGRIVESGNHAELLARRGLYYRLYQLQYAEHAAASA